MGAVRTMRRVLRTRLEDNGDLESVRCMVDAMTPLLQQICDERLWQQREGGCVAAIAQEHEERMRPLLALKETLGNRGGNAGSQSDSWAAAKKKTAAAVNVARVAAGKEAESEQGQMRQAHQRKEQQL